MNLNQITVPSLNVKATIAFYQTLGLKLIVESLPNYARFECPEGDSTFSIHQVEKLPTGNGTVIYFECQNLEDKVTSLEKQGVKFVHGPMDQSWLWKEVKLLDPDGNQIKLYWAGKNRKYPPWRVEG